MRETSRCLRTPLSIPALLMVLALLQACSTPAAPQEPAAPTNVTAVQGPGYITLSWQDNSDNETGFQVYRQAVSGLTSQQVGTLVGSVSANQTSYVDLDVELQQQYDYSVVATNAAGSSPAAAAPSPTQVPIGVDLMVGTINRWWTADSNGTGLIVYFMFAPEVVEDQALNYVVQVAGPPGWNDDSPITFSCAWNGCYRSRGFAFSSNISVTAVAGVYTVTVEVGSQTFTATARLEDPNFKFPQPTNIVVSDASAAGATISWDPPAGTMSQYVLLYEGDYGAFVNGWLVEGSTTSRTVDDLDLEDGVYTYEVAPINADLHGYPLKVSPFGVAYDSKLVAVGNAMSPLCTSGEQIVAVPDTALRQLIRDALGKSTGDLTCSDMALVTDVTSENNNVASLEGLQYAANLTDIHLYGNQVSDLTPLAQLTQLRNLNLNLNEVTDVGPLENLTSLRELHLCCSTGNITNVQPLEGLVNIVGLNLSVHHLGDAVLWPLLENYPNLLRLWIGENDLTDLSPLANHPNLQVLQISTAQITDLTPVAALDDLYELQLQWSTVSDITPLYTMTGLTFLNIRGLNLGDVAFLEEFEELWWLDIGNNGLTSLAPLVANPGIGAGDFVDARENSFDLTDAAVQADIQALIDRGVDLLY